MNATVINNAPTKIRLHLGTVYFLGSLAGLLTAATAAQLDAPVIKAPLPNSVNVYPRSVTLDWQKSPRATAYEWRILKDGAVVKSDNVNAPLTSADAGNLKWDTQFSWRVRAFEGTQPGKWTDPIRFMTQAQPRAAILSEPANGMTDAGVPSGLNKRSVTLRWGPLSGINRYEVLCKDHAGRIVFNAPVDGLSKDLTLAEMETYSWNVNGIRNGEPFQDSATWSFTTGDNIGVPVLTSPAEGCNKYGEVQFWWDSDNEAANYVLKAWSPNGTLAIRKTMGKVTRPSIDLALETSNPFGRWTWQVTVVSIHGTTKVSNVGSFNYCGITHAPYVSGPAPDDNPPRLTFNWDRPGQGYKYQHMLTCPDSYIETNVIAHTYITFNINKDLRPHVTPNNRTFTFKVRAWKDNKHQGEWSEDNVFTLD